MTAVDDLFADLSDIDQPIVLEVREHCLHLVEAMDGASDRQLRSFVLRNAKPLAEQLGHPPKTVERILRRLLGESS